jgi:hypothetical protein
MILPAFHNTTKSNSRGRSEHHGKKILELRSPTLVEDYEDKSPTNGSRRVNMTPNLVDHRYPRGLAQPQ